MRIALTRPAGGGCARLRKWRSGVHRRAAVLVDARGIGPAEPELRVHGGMRQTHTGHQVEAAWNAIGRIEVVVEGIQILETGDALGSLP